MSADTVAQLANHMAVSVANIRMIYADDVTASKRHATHMDHVSYHFNGQVLIHGALKQSRAFIHAPILIRWDHERGCCCAVIKQYSCIRHRPSRDLCG